MAYDVYREDHMSNLDVAAAIERHLEEQAGLHLAARVDERQEISRGEFALPRPGRPPRIWRPLSRPT
jgi:hypothetical protein